MIGSLIYYGLYPLTQLLDRLSELWWKDCLGHPDHPLSINGKEACDGGGSLFRMPSEQKNALLDQCCSIGSAPLEKSYVSNKEKLDTEVLVQSTFGLEIREVVVADEKMEQQEEHQHFKNIEETSTEEHDLEPSEGGGAFTATSFHSNVEPYPEPSERGGAFTTTTLHCYLEPDPEPSGRGGAFTTTTLHSYVEPDPEPSERDGAFTATTLHSYVELDPEPSGRGGAFTATTLHSYVEPDPEPSGRGGAFTTTTLHSYVEPDPEPSGRDGAFTTTTLHSYVEPDPEPSEGGGANTTEMEQDDSELPKDKQQRSVPSAMTILLDEKKETNYMIEKEMFSTIKWANTEPPKSVGKEKGVNSQEKRKQDKEMGIVSEVAQRGDTNVNIREGETRVYEGTCVFDLSELLKDSNAEVLNSFTQVQSVHTWHFPVGPGLSETVGCPSVQFPDISYYPAFQDNSSYEGTWRLWENLCEDSYPSETPSTAKFVFTFMSYNILAQDLLEANSGLYQHCSEEELEWENRFHCIQKQLQDWEPDIMCLQEVQEDHYLEQMYPGLIKMGYSCVYKRRTGTKTDGCAVCFRSDRFSQLSVDLLEFRRHDCELLDRDNVGIVLLLQPVGEDGEVLQLNPICVANTHLLFNPRRGDVKLAQLAIMLAEIDRVVMQCKAKGSECEVILCGDFNSLPNMPLYQLIVTGQLYYHGLPAWMVSGQEDFSAKLHHRRLYAPLWPSSLGISDSCQYFAEGKPHVNPSGKLQYNHDFLRQLRYCQAACMRPPDMELIPGVTDNTPNPEEKLTFAPRFRNTVSHGLKLSSVYNSSIAGTESLAVTTMHSEGAAMVDYIFYSTRRDCSEECKDCENGLKLLGRLALLSEEVLWSLKGLPNYMFPSDHLSLLAKFQLS